jgi:hypothetical protein
LEDVLLLACRPLAFERYDQAEMLSLLQRFDARLEPLAGIDYIEDLEGYRAAIGDLEKILERAAGDYRDDCCKGLVDPLYLITADGDLALPGKVARGNG